MSIIKFLEDSPPPQKKMRRIKTTFPTHLFSTSILFESLRYRKHFQAAANFDDGKKNKLACFFQYLNAVLVHKLILDQKVLFFRGVSVLAPIGELQ
jgi:hypothetical protein